MALPLSRAALFRAAPFALFMLLLAARGMAPADGAWGLDPRWIYAWGVLAVGALLWWFRGEYGELARQTWPDGRELGLAVAVGGLVFLAWIQLDRPWMQLAQPTAIFHPVDAQGALIWPLVAVRLVGAALLVPLMEELFWRSFLMRWIERAQFEAVDPQRIGLKAVVLSTFLFMLAHVLWLAAIIAGLAYAWLYRRTGKLWVAVIAHGVTNGALGVWVVVTGNWQFW